MAAETMGIRYVQSHIDDPLGCRIAREIIKVMVEGEWVLKGHEKGKYLRSRLMDIAARNKGIKEIRGRGMMNVVMLDKGVSGEAIFNGLLGAGSKQKNQEGYFLTKMPRFLLMENSS